MSSRTGPVLFEAICTPSRSLGRRGMVALSAALLGGAAATGGLFLALGAWPILGFAGAEALLALGLVGLHRRWAQRSMEVLLLTEGSLTIRRTDRRGRQREFSLDPYWTRLRLEERPGRVSLLVLERRGEAIEVGQLLGEAQKRDLAAALGAALRRWREPIFDNPQLRDDG
jgi:uncharacterized membrane protein